MNPNAVSFVKFMVVLLFIALFLELFVDLPDWWYTLRLTDWLFRHFLLSIRWSYRKTRAAILWLWRQMVDKYHLVRWAIFSRLSEHFLHYYAIEESGTLILYIHVQPWRVYLVCFFCLLLHNIKVFFLHLRSTFGFFYKKIYDNTLTSFLLDRPEPLSFFKFSLMLGVLVFLSLMVFRLCFLSYSNFLALLAFFGITLTSKGNFLFALLVLTLVFFFILFLEITARLTFVVFLRVSRLSRSDFRFGIFFPFFLFFFFVLFWLLVLLFTTVSSLAGFIFCCFFSFLLFDSFFYYAYKVLWGESQVTKKVL